MKNKIFIIICDVAVCSVLLFVNERWVCDKFLNQLLMTISISGLTTAMFSFITSKIDKDNIVTLLRQSFPFIKQCVGYGMMN